MIPRSTDSLSHVSSSERAENPDRVSDNHGFRAADQGSHCVHKCWIFTLMEGKHGERCAQLWNTPTH